MTTVESGCYSSMFDCKTGKSYKCKLNEGHNGIHKNGKTKWDDQPVVFGR